MAHCIIEITTSCSHFLYYAQPLVLIYFASFGEVAECENSLTISLRGRYYCLVSKQQNFFPTLRFVLLLSLSKTGLDQLYRETAALEH